ncbi:LPS export ABC transporter permease LptF [Candidatus Fukatsuia anoeciicola]|uniref:LPS export ABC transporter permease LptF n=1 Tax=Candidatus Fukatsuia anoeciicola TaxID=2994492 RepID=UPI003463B6AE
MIIIKYLAKETAKNQIIILFILLLIFFSQKLVVILRAVVNGDIPINLVFYFLGLGLPEMAQLILPLSLFLSLLMTYNKIYTKSEITAIYACGLGKKSLIITALSLALITAALAAVNVLWLGPWSMKYQEKVLNNAQVNLNLTALLEGRFQSSKNGNTVVFVKNINGKKFNRVFLAQLKPNGNQQPSIMVAKSGYMSECIDGSQLITLDKGTRYEGTALLRNFRITDFEDYQVTIGYQSIIPSSSSSEQMSTSSLWYSNYPAARAEFHWRLTLIIAVIIMALLVVPLSVVNSRQGRVLSVLPAILLYLVFFLFQSSLHSNASRGKLDPLLWLWMINGIYLALAIILNMWDSLVICKLRAYFRSNLRGIA